MNNLPHDIRKIREKQIHEEFKKHKELVEKHGVLGAAIRTQTHCGHRDGQRAISIDCHSLCQRVSEPIFKRGRE